MLFESAPARAPALLMAIFAIAACGDDADPGTIVEPNLGLTVRVAASLVSAPTIGTDAELYQYIKCAVTLEATASGVGTATWQDATLYWFAGVDRTVPVDSTPIPVSTVRASWSGDQIRAGDEQQARWEMLAYAPFAIRAAFRYRQGTGGRTYTAATTFTCGPDVPADGIAPPDVATLAVREPGGALEPGDTLTLEYTVTSAIGLWETRVVLGGACSTTMEFGEALLKNVSRTVPLVLPFDCVLGLPVTVGVAAMDAALQERSRAVTPALTVTDVTPPSVYIASVPVTGGSLVPGVVGTFFVDDSIMVRFAAWDNHALRALVWEVQPHGFRDSLVVTGADVMPWVSIRLRPDWVGPIELRFFARDVSGNVSTVVATIPGDVRVLPTATPPTVQATVPGTVRAAVIDRSRGVLYLLQPDQSHVRVLEMGALATLETIATPVAGLDLDLTPGGDSLILTLPGIRALGIVDLRAATRVVTVVPLTSLDTTVDQTPAFVRTLANGRAFVRLGGGNPDGWTLLELDLATGTESTRTDAGAAGNVSAAEMERSHDHTAVVLAMPGAQLQRYGMAQDAFGTIRGAAVGGPLSVDLDGQRVGISRYVYDGSLLPLREVESMYPAGSSVYEISVLTPSGEYLYHALPPWGILRSRVSDGALVDRIASPLSPNLLRVSADGTILVELEDTYTGTTRVRVSDLR